MTATADALQLLFGLLTAEPPPATEVSDSPGSIWGGLLSLLPVIVLVALNGFFVAAEFALVGVRKTRLEQLAAEGKGSAKAVQKAVANLYKYIAASQVGLTLASLALGWVGEPTLASLL